MKIFSMEIKKIIGFDVLLPYPNFIEIIIIQKGAKKMQLRRIISRKWDFCFRLLPQVKPHLINYTTTE